MGHGGYRLGAGRKSKAEEQSLIKKIGPLEPLALNALKSALEIGERWAVKMYFEYMYGRPTQKVSEHIVQEQPLFPEIKITRHVVSGNID